MPRLYCLLLLLTVGWGALSAQTNITLSNFSATPGTGDAPTTLTFNIRWSPPADESLVWSDTVWVFIDYNNKGTMTRLPLVSGAATLTKTSWNGAQVIEVAGNPNGVWVVGNARTAGTFSATCRGGFETRPYYGGLCIYALNYPPLGRYESGTITFTGTPPFYLTLNDESSATLTKQNHPHTYSYTYDPANPVTAFTDASRAPGRFINSPMPADPTVTPGARCGAGVVPLSASAQDGAVIDWYDSPDHGEALASGSNTYNTPTLTQTTTYYAQARYPDSGLTSQRVPVVAAIHLHEGAIDWQEDD